MDEHDLRHLLEKGGEEVQAQLDAVLKFFKVTIEAQQDALLC